MMTNAGRDAALGTLGGYLGLFKAITDWRAGTVTEADYTGYGTRPAFPAGAAANTTPTGGRQVANSSTVTFPKNTGVDQVVIGFGWWTAATGGTLRQIALIDDDAPVVGVVDDLTAELVIAPAHGLVADQRVFVMAAPGAALPTGLSENTAYYVLASGLVTDGFKVSTTSGGSAVNITAKGAALFIPHKPATIAANATPEFATGAAVFQL